MTNSDYDLMSPIRKMQFSKEAGMNILRYIFPLKPNSFNPQGFLHIVCLVVIGYTL